MPRVNRAPSLFEVSAKVPDGFSYRQNFISEAEEHELIQEIQKLDLTPFKYYQFIGKRRTASFGWQYEFGAVKSQQLQTHRHFSYRSGHAPETSSTLIRTV